jgi:hypothetical protein
MKQRLLLRTVVLLLPVVALWVGCANLGRNREEPATSADELELDIETPSSPLGSRQRGAPAPYSLSETGQEIERNVGVGTR